MSKPLLSFTVGPSGKRKYEKPLHRLIGEDIAHMRDQGMTYAEIGKIYGITAGSASATYQVWDIENGRRHSSLKGVPSVENQHAAPGR